MGDRKNNKPVHTQGTNGFDFLIAFGSGVVNLLKIEKVICIIFLYILLRDFVFLSRLPENMDYQSFLIDPKIIEKVFETDNNVIIIMACLICILVIIIVLLIGIIKFVYKKEIQRLVDERHDLLHNVKTNSFVPLKKHNTSEKAVQ